MTQQEKRTTRSRSKGTASKKQPTTKKTTTKSTTKPRTSKTDVQSTVAPAHVTKEPKPCWFEIITLTGDDFEEQVAKRLRPKDYDPELWPPSKSIESTIRALRKRYDTTPDDDLKPILAPITKDLMRDAYWMSSTSCVLSWDENAHKATLYRKSVTYKE